MKDKKNPFLRYRVGNSLQGTPFKDPENYVGYLLFGESKIPATIFYVHMPEIIGNILLGNKTMPKAPAYGKWFYTGHFMFPDLSLIPTFLDSIVQTNQATLYFQTEDKLYKLVKVELGGLQLCNLVYTMSFIAEDITFDKSE